MRLYRWSPDVRGTTQRPSPGAFAILRSGLRRLPWSICRVVARRDGGHDLENIIDLRTVRDCREWVELAAR